MAPASCRSSSRATGVTTPTSRRSTPQWGGFAYGRELDGIPAAGGHGAQLSSASRSRPRTSTTASHDIARLRRLLPVPRRHGRHGAGAHRRRAEGLRGRLDQRPTTSARGPCRRRRTASSGPAWSTRAGSGDAAPRLQGSLRAGRDRRLPLRVRRDGGRDPDWMYEKLAQEYVLDEDEPGVPAARRTRGRCAASSSGWPRPPSVGCGSSPTPRCSWQRCSRSISRVSWRSDDGARIQ
jgi:hypothetical protein